jgi:hypothetical protein
MNERLDNLRQQRAVDPEKLGDHFDQSLRHLEQRARENGIPVRWEKRKGGSRGRVIGFDEPVKRDIELFELYLPAGSTAFRYLSGFVHSKPWVLIPARRALPSADPDVALSPTALEVGEFVPVLEIVMDLVDETIGHWLSLGGQSPEVWAAAKGREA